jgi:predicted PurR-regulated permease PerM
MILGIPYAPFLGLWAAVSEIIPVIGPWLGGIAGVAVTLAVDSSKVFWVIILYVAVQLLEAYLLVPRIHGQYFQLHPAVILVLIVIGGYFAGFWGVILIIPVTSVIIRLFRFINRTTRKEELHSPTA